MTDAHRLAQLIASCWRVSGEGSRIPTSNGLLDRALKATWDAGGFPDWARDRLHFVDSRIGLQCVEVPEILEWAQRSQLTSAPNPSYETTEVQISENAAKRLLGSLDVSEGDAAKWGKSLRCAMSLAEGELVGLDHARVEDY
ncbi:MAG TPA: hypothetical protein VMF30_05505 [Pirellulales bacterium]|nr:hypothetical protein [Pirellulales bacterium]